MWYAGVVFIYNGCQNNFNYKQWTCGAACYQSDPFLVTFDWVANNLLPAAIVILMNALLCGRVLYNKCKIAQTHMLKRNQKLILQLLLNSTVYVCAWFPLTILGIILTFKPDDELIAYLYQYIFNYTVYLTPLLNPFFTLITLPELYGQPMRR